MEGTRQLLKTKSRNLFSLLWKNYAVTHPLTKISGYATVQLDTSFSGRVFPANHLAMLLTSKIYTHKYKHKKFQTTNPGLVAYYDIRPGNRSPLLLQQKTTACMGQVCLFILLIIVCVTKHQLITVNSRDALLRPSLTINIYQPWTIKQESQTTSIHNGSSALLQCRLTTQSIN